MKAGIAAVLLAVVVIWAALSWPRPATSPMWEETRETIETARVEAQAHRQDIKEHRETTIRKGGEIRAKKEAEIRTLSPDALVERHRSALLRFGGLSDDHASSKGVDSD